MQATVTYLRREGCSRWHIADPNGRARCGNASRTYAGATDVEVKHDLAGPELLELCGGCACPNRARVYQTRPRPVPRGVSGRRDQDRLLRRFRGVPLDERVVSEPPAREPDRATAYLNEKLPFMSEPGTADALLNGSGTAPRLRGLIPAAPPPPPVHVPDPAVKERVRAMCAYFRLPPYLRR
jgi:hypothetical protein